MYLPKLNLLMESVRNMHKAVIQKILDEKLIVIVRGMQEEKILPLTEALLNGGVRLMEITYNLSMPDNHRATAQAIKAVADRFKEDMYIGAGTVASPTLAEMAKEAGALYIVSPNTDADVIRRTVELDMVSIPGALTPGECLTAHNAGADFIKLFPAGEMGAGYLKAIKAPLSHLRFIATGGIDLNNIPDFLKAGAAGFGVGGNLVDKTLIEAGEFDKITELAKRYIEAVN